MMLELKEINSYYGSSHVLFDVSLEVGQGSLVTLIGRNGAGKTTTLKSIMGIVTPRSGSIEYQGMDLVGMEPNEVSQQGIAYVPETRELFTQLSVYENLRLGYLGHDTGTDFETRLEDIFSYFPRLEERQDQKAGSLSGGEQQMVAIGRGLISDPDCLLIDEPTEGLMPSLVDKLREILVRINEEGKTVLLVEQNVELALEISDYGYVLDEGNIVTHAPSEELLEDEEVIERYLAV
jgi:branched-chain amino acid transport system ATP-binding protein